MSTSFFQDVHIAGKPVEWAERPGVRDVTREATNVACEIVEGDIPRWMKGSLYHQMGGAFFDVDDVGLDGLAHISAFHLQDGKASYSNKFMRTKHFRNLTTSGKRNWGGTASAMEQSGVFSRAVEWLKDLRYAFSGPKVQYVGFNPNVNVWALGPTKDGSGDIRVAASTETDGVVCEFHPKTLDTLHGTATLEPQKGQIITNAAHWFFDQDVSGGFHVGLELDWTLTMKGPIFTFQYVIWHGDEPPFKRVMEHPLATFPYAERQKQPDEKRAAYMHTIAQTENYLVLVESAMRLKYGDLLANHFPNGFFGLFESVKAPVNFKVFKIDRENKGQLKFVGDMPCKPEDRYMVWHLGNSYEDGDNIVIDVSAHKLSEEQGTALSEGDKSDLNRFTIDLTSKSASVKQLLEHTANEDYEFPNINPRFHHMQHNFIYALGNSGVRKDMSVVKLNCTTGETQHLEELDGNWLITEPIFVSKPGATDEEDGIVLIEGVNTNTGESELMFVEPKAFTIVARVKSPVATNIGLHSTWVASDRSIVAKY